MRFQEQRAVLWGGLHASSGRRVALVSNHNEGAAGPLHLGTGGYHYDSRSTPMTIAAICATREMSWSPSYYRGEQYDPDLNLYYLRARYYNPATGRFMSRDPEDGKAKSPASLHKYLYADGDPVNATDPRGRASFVEWTFGVQIPANVLYVAWSWGAACVAESFAVHHGLYVETALDQNFCDFVGILNIVVFPTPWNP